MPDILHYPWGTGVHAGVAASGASVHPFPGAGLYVTVSVNVPGLNVRVPKDKAPL